jgi:hypothetical protein
MRSLPAFFAEAAGRDIPTAHFIPQMTAKFLHKKRGIV